jgi:hypothetical protein
MAVRDSKQAYLARKASRNRSRFTCVTGELSRDRDMRTRTAEESGNEGIKNGIGRCQNVSCINDDATESGAMDACVECIAKKPAMRVWAVLVVLYG